MSDKTAGGDLSEQHAAGATKGLDELEALVARSPDDASSWSDLAGARLEAADPAGAIEAFDRAVDLSPRDSALRLRYGLALEALGALDDAAYQLLQGQRVSPDDPHLLRALGTVFYKKGLHDKAIRFLGRATTVAPSDARSFFALGVVHDARNDPGAAVAALREAIRLDPAFVDARRTLIDALVGIGEHAQAISAIDDLLKVAPRDEQAAQNREVLETALEQMAAHRLLGRHEEDFERSALVHEGELKRRGRLDDGRLRYSNKLSEVLVSFASTPPEGVIHALLLVLADPQKAAQTRDKVFGVTIVGKDGRRVAADYATAASLTFLREALGVPMTQAAVFYQRLLAGEAEIDFAGARIGFTMRPHPGREGEEQTGLSCVVLEKR